MRAVLPGKPRATLQAICSARWSERQIVAYISGNSLVILDGPESLIQTICQDEVEQLDAVAIDTATGKLATSSGNDVFVYEPYGLEEFTKWSQQCSFTAFERVGEGNEGGSGSSGNSCHATDPAQPCTLSWGMPGELLVGGSSLKLYHLMKGDRPQLSWEVMLSSDARLASFSSDADLIASIAQYDPLVKVWRRRWSGGGPDQNTFDFCYLPHPAPVTDFFWRKPEKRASQGGQHVLYTVCVDKKLRVWAQLDHHSLQTLELWAEVDLQDVIQPRHLKPESVSEKRSVFVIPGTDFDATTKRALQGDVDSAKRPFLEHLSEIASQKPDICVVVDGKGHMSAWGLQNIGSKRRKDSDIFNIALVEDFNLLDHLSMSSSGSTEVYTRFMTILRDAATPSFSILVHYFDGSIVWMDGRMDELFDPAPSARRLRRQALWTAHEQPIDKMVRNASGLSIISRSEQGEALVWQQTRSSKVMPSSLQKVSTLQFEDTLLGMCILDRGSHFVTLQNGKVCLWESSSPEAEQIACCALSLPSDPVRVIRVPSQVADGASRFVAVLTASVEGAVFEVNLPRGHSGRDAKKKTLNGVSSEPVNGALNGTAKGTRECSISLFCSIKQTERRKYRAVSAVDPVGYSSSVPDSLDAFASDVALAYTEDGIVETFAAKLDIAEKELSWLKTASIDTGLQNPSLAVASSSRKVAIVNEAGTGLLIWDTRNGDLEFDQNFGVGEDISDLDWTATPDSQSLLAVGFPHKVLVYGQMRYNYLNPEPAWAAIREIYIRDLTPHPIGDSTWLSGGNLVIGAGRQLFIYEDAISGQDKSVKDIPVATHVTSPGRLFSRVNLLNGPLPVFHPQFLTQMILAGRLGLAQQIVVTLHKVLRFWTEGEDIDMTLGISTDELLADEDPLSSQRVPKQRLQFDSDAELPQEEETVSEELAAALNEKLARASLPYMSSQEQFYLSNLVESVALTEKHRRSVDINAARFITFFRQFMLIKVSEHQYRAGVTWREYSWAYHSNSQDILVDLVSKQYNGKMLWSNAKEAGVFMWMSDITALRAQFEVVARNEYSKTDERNPVDCSLFYLALRKKNVLVGLWRMATWNREQAGTQKLLANNFAEARWKTAALKNAYALLGKRRFEYAAAFFLLADRLEDAVNVCVNQIKDVQLAVAVARVYQGDESPVLHKLLTTHVLPAAARSGDRWQASWAFWLLGRRDRAIRALITPIWTLLDFEDDDEEEAEDEAVMSKDGSRSEKKRNTKPASPTPSPPATTMQSRSFLANDPALVAMYAQFRESSLQALQGSMQVSAREEREFVLRTARLYARMGCDWLALNLVRNWSFLLQQDEMAQGQGSAATTLTIRQGSKEAASTDGRKASFTGDSASMSSQSVPDPRKLLRRRSSLVVDDLTAPPKSPTLGMKSASGGNTGGGLGGFGGFGNSEDSGSASTGDNGAGKKGKAKPKPPPTMFEEPEANSLLDQFGF